MSTLHPSPHPHAGRAVTLRGGYFSGQVFEVRDWWSRLWPMPWTESQRRSALGFHPQAEDYGLWDDQVVLGWLRGQETLVHASFLPDGPGAAAAAAAACPVTVAA